MIRILLFSMQLDVPHFLSPEGGDRAINANTACLFFKCSYNRRVTLFPYSLYTIRSGYIYVVKNVAVVRVDSSQGSITKN